MHVIASSTMEIKQYATATQNSVRIFASIRMSWFIQQILII